MTFEIFRSYVEIAYFLSGIVLAVIGVIGLRQLKLMKFDVSTRCRREAMDSSIKIVDRYLDKFVTMYDEMTKIKTPEEVIIYEEGPIYKGTFDSLPPLDPKVIAGVLEKARKLQLHKIFNELEIISASVLSGLADDKFVFSIIGLSYCDAVAGHYDFLSIASQNGHFPSTVKLFDIWRHRLIKVKLADKKKACDDGMTAIPDVTIKSIGQ